MFYLEIFNLHQLRYAIGVFYLLYHLEGKEILSCSVFLHPKYCTVCCLEVEMERKGKVQTALTVTQTSSDS